MYRPHPLVNLVVICIDLRIFVNLLVSCIDLTPGLLLCWANRYALFLLKPYCPCVFSLFRLVIDDHSKQDTECTYFVNSFGLILLTSRYFGWLFAELTDMLCFYWPLTAHVFFLFSVFSSLIIQTRRITCCFFMFFSNKNFCS